MSRIIDPTYDPGFKLLFGRENVSNELLIGLLNALFEGDPEFSEIVSITYRNTELPGEWYGGRGIRYDIQCETSSGHRFIVEMQKGWQPYFIDRAIYYICRGITEQGYRGKDENEKEWDYELIPVIGVFLCEFKIGMLEDKFISRVTLCDEEIGKPVSDKMRYIFIQLPSFKKTEIECNSFLEQWIYNIKNMGSLQSVAFQNEHPVFRRLAKVSDISSLSPQERNVYEADLKYARDYVNKLRGAEMLGMEQGFAKGHAAGLEAGHSAGIAEGRMEGRVDTERSVVERMRENGFDDNEIFRLTGIRPQSSISK